MKPRCTNQGRHALTLVEVLVVICTLALLAAVLLLAALSASKKIPLKINCHNHLKEIGLSYRLWGGDNGNKFPMQISATNRGTQELALAGDATAIFRGMSNELGSPKILICPADLSRFAATNFNRDLNGKISYFVNVDASDAYPQMILSGDDNFAIGGVPVKSGLLEVSAKTPIAWTAARHKFSGNLLLADGSVHHLVNANLKNLIQQTGLATNRLVLP